MKPLLLIFVNALYLLALINPVSKIAVLSGLAAKEGRRDMVAAVRKSSFTAAGILLGAMFFGDIILQQIFHVELYSLRVSGGVVLFWVGFNALRKGVFFEQDSAEHALDLAVVPLACPMIAGPATIAAAIEEQSITTRDIAGNLGQAFEGVKDANHRVAQTALVTQGIAKEILGVNEASADMAMGTSQIKLSADELSRLAEQLKQLVGNFKV